MATFHDRLKEERKRLKLNQELFATHGGVKRDAQINYENGSRKPDSAYIEAIASIGVDVLYVVTGRREAGALSAEDSTLLELFHNATGAGRAAAVAALTTKEAAANSKFQMNFSGATIGSQTMVDGGVKIKSRKVVGVEKKK